MYRVAATRVEGGEVQQLMQTFDDLIYPSNDTIIRTHAARANNNVFTGFFSEEYSRGDFKGCLWPVETVQLNAEHTIYLGAAAIKQCYKIQFHSSIMRDDLGPNRVSTLYYLEEIAGKGQRFFGTIIRPNITNDPNCKEEQMTAYDCVQLQRELIELIGLAAVDAKDRTVV